MKDKIFEKMKEYGWNLGENSNKDFEIVYNRHYDFIESCYESIAETDITQDVNMNEINSIDFEDMICFISDFLRAINDIDLKERGK